MSIQPKVEITQIGYVIYLKSYMFGLHLELL